MMRKNFLLIAVLLIAASAVYGIVPLRPGFGFGAQTAQPPLTLPLVGANDPIFTFLGSFKAPANFNYGGGAMSVNGTTMYMGALYYYNSGQSYVPGIGSFTIPTLSGVAAYDGSNGQAVAVVNPTTKVDGSGNPILDFGQAASSTYVIFTGSLVYNGNLYITAAPYYDAAIGDTGWIVQSSTAITGFGTPNSASTARGTNVRLFAGPLGVVPAAWQPYLGGPCFVLGGVGLPIISTTTNGFGFSTFDPASYSSGGGAVPITELLNYYNTGLPYYGNNPQMLSDRSFSGPFPLAGGCGTGVTCSYTANATPTNGTTSLTLTAAFQGGVSEHYTSGPYQLTFSDGETRVVHLTNGSTSVPDGTTGPATFTALANCPCTTAVTITAVGDNYQSQYDGPLGYGFIVPGSRTLLYINVHEYGPGGAAGSGCDTGASGANDTPVAPDSASAHYREVQLYAYDLAQLYNVKQGSQQQYTASPYASWSLPNWATIAQVANNCVGGYTDGFFFFDPNTNILYGNFDHNQGGDQNIIIDEWSVSGT